MVTISSVVTMVTVDWSLYKYLVTMVVGYYGYNHIHNQVHLVRLSTSQKNHSTLTNINILQTICKPTFTYCFYLKAIKIA